MLLCLVTLTLMLLPELVRLPVPAGGLHLTTARLETGAEISLPHTLRPAAGGPASVTYHLTFTLAARPEGPQEFYVPAARHALTFAINGRPGPEPSQSVWLQPEQGMTTVMLMPHHLLVPGENRMAITLTRQDGSIPFYLSPVYLGPSEGFSQSPVFSVLLAGQGRIAAFVLHLVVLVGLVTLWSARLHDPVFRWLALLGSTSLVATLPEIGWAAPLVLRPPQGLLMGSFGLMALGLALALADRPRPGWLVHGTWLAPVIVLGLALLMPPQSLLPTLVGVFLALAGHVAAAITLIICFFEKRRWTVGLLAVPFLLIAWIGLRDVLVVTGFREAPFLLSSYVRPLTMLAVVVILMQRLATSLNRLDRSNDELRERLAEQERELLALHERERQHAARSVLEEERQRLTLDLHDGLSGHLVSIIALGERGAEPQALEQAARAALDDLRLVINSLDIGDGDLPLALAGFRERAEPQLRRLGRRLDWSMENLPEISGVTPGHALSVLRVFQEAITNAIRHGTGTISVSGRTEAGGAMMEIVNDCAAPTGPGGKGHGLGNMQRRAEVLGGRLDFTRDGPQARLALWLPLHLGQAG